MNQDLTHRQIQILKSIIDEYIETAMPVGSLTIEKKYDMGVSPATIRNEMVFLTKMGYLKKSHSSSGRTPTPIALKYYVNNLLNEQQLSTAEEVAVKEKVWDYRNQLEKFLREATRELAKRTGEIAITATSNGDMYTAGAANLLTSPEFYDIDVARTLLGHLDEFDYWWGLFESCDLQPSLSIILGEDMGGGLLESCGYVYGCFNLGSAKGTIGVVGPARINYNRIYPTVRYFRDLVNELSGSW